MSYEVLAILVISFSVVGCSSNEGNGISRKEDTLEDGPFLIIMGS